MADIDWSAERTKAGSATQKSLIDLARRAGYTVEVGEGKGSHAKVTGLGLRRPVIIQDKMWRQVALEIISDLRKGAS